MQKLDCAEFGSCRICIVENMDNLDFAEFRLCRNWMLQNCLSHCAYVQHWYLKDSFCTLFFRPRTCPRAFLQSFALYFLCSKAKDCRNVLGRVLGRKNKVHAPSFRISKLKRALLERHRMDRKFMRLLEKYDP